MTGAGQRTAAVAQRAFDSVLRSRALLAVAFGYALAVLGFAWVASGGGYLALSLNLLTPLAVLVPLVAFAFGYRSILDDRLRGELAVLRTYPLEGRSYVLGVFLGRAAALLVVVVTPLLVAVGVVVAFRQETISVLAAHETADSPIIYVRLLVLTATFALTTLAIAIGVSALAAGSRSAIALAVAALLALVLGLDLAVVSGLAANLVPPGVLDVVVAVSPLSAFRGLGLELVVGPVAPGAVAGGVDPLSGIVALVAWTGGALVLAGRVVFR